MFPDAKRQAADVRMIKKEAGRKQLPQETVGRPWSLRQKEHELSESSTEGPHQPGTAKKPAYHMARTSGPRNCRRH